MTRCQKRHRRKLLRAKSLMRAGTSQKDAAARVGWTARYLRKLLADERREFGAEPLAPTVRAGFRRAKSA